MRTLLILGKARAVGTVECRENRLVAVGRQPSLNHAGSGKTHGVRRLVAVYTRPPVCAQWHEKGMTFRVHRPGGIDHTECSVRILERIGRRQSYITARLD